MNSEQMARVILDLVRDRGGALIHEMVSVIGEAAIGSGTLALSENVVLWSQVSPEFVEAFNKVLPELTYHRANPVMIAFFAEQGFPALPVVSAGDYAFRHFEYTEPHWLPTVYFLKGEPVAEGTI